MRSLTIAEVDSKNWQLTPMLEQFVDRDQTTTVAEHLRSRGVVWGGGAEKADVRVYKAAATGVSPVALLRAAVRCRPFAARSLHLIGEPRELAPLAYLLASARNTLAVAPGDELPRLSFGSAWIDPQLDGWHKRLDRFCWIARPTPERVAMARTMLSMGLPLDLYSKQAWPLSCWKGYVDNELETGRRYKYRIACENFHTHKYHSEKLFYGIRSGCITFYKADPRLELPFAAGAYVPFCAENLTCHKRFDSTVVSGIEAFMFSDRWQVYSLRSFFDRIVDLARTIV